MSKTIFLTGGSGFIGHNIVEQLASRYHIYAPTHQELNLLDENEVEKCLRNHPSDIIIHAANIGGKKSEAECTNIISSNIRIFLNFVRCKQYFKRMIYFGSGAEFGKQASIHKAEEKDFGKRMPSDDFGLYKYTVASFIEETKLPIYNLRLFGVYGKYEEYRFRFVSNIICQALLDIPITIRHNAKFDYLYINDFVRILEHFINNKPKYSTYNIGSGKPRDFLTMAKRILFVMNKPQKITVLDKESNFEYTCSIKRLNKEIPNFQYTNFDKTIRVLADWYVGRLPLIKRTEILSLI
ncbi:MAG: NAD-dependent epimerase/dehydratase family protein [Microgenomates group bacterium]